MKLGKFLSMGVLSVLALGACTPNADDNSEWNDGSQAVSFTSQIQGAKTRATNNAWDAEGSDEVGILVKQNGVFGDVVNKHYYVSAEGNLSTASADDAIYYPADGSKVDFVAYYPYSAVLADNAYAIDVTNQSPQSAIDLLYSINATNKDKNVTTPVQLTFKHQLTKIVLNITKDATIPTLEGLKVAITGTKTKGSFALLNGSLTPDDASTKAIEALVNKAGTLAEAIILPVNNLSGAKITFTLGGETKSWNIPEGQNYAAGTQHTYPVTIKETGGKISVSFGDASIDDWTPVAGGNIDIDFGDGGGEVDPPTPGGEEQTILLETFGGTESSRAVAKITSSLNSTSHYPYVNEFTDWDNKDKGYTYSGAFEQVSGKYYCADIRSIAYKTDANRTETTKTNNLWLPSGHDTSLKIEGINTTGYTGIKLTFEAAANVFNAADATDLNKIQVKWNGLSLTVPSKSLTGANKDGNVFFSVEVPEELTAGDNCSLEFLTPTADNQYGFRICNIKIVGTK